MISAVFPMVREAWANRLRRFRGPSRPHAGEATSSLSLAVPGDGANLPSAGVGAPRIHSLLPRPPSEKCTDVAVAWSTLWGHARFLTLLTQAGPMPPMRNTAGHQNDDKGSGTLRGL